MSGRWPAAPKLLNLDSIRIDGGTQARCKLDVEAVSAYAESIKEGAQFPVIIVFSDPEANWLADGFHRYHAYRECGHIDTLCDVRRGTRLDAVKFALGANSANGLRRTNADKRHGALMALKEFPDISDVQLAEMCAVTDTFISKMRKEAQPPTVGGSSEPAVRTGADGKKRKVPLPRTNNINRAITRPIVAPDLTPEQQASVDEAARDSVGMWRLKNEWRKAGKKDKSEFRQWISVDDAAAAENEFAPGGALICAQHTIGNLEKIQRTDIHRQAAFDKVLQWIASQKAKDI